MCPPLLPPHDHNCMHQITNHKHTQSSHHQNEVNPSLYMGVHTWGMYPPLLPPHDHDHDYMHQITNQKRTQRNCCQQKNMCPPMFANLAAQQE